MNEILIRREKKYLGHPQCARLVRDAVNFTLKCENIQEDCLVSVLLTDDEGICRLNKEFRNVDSTTDVLSFPMNELVPGDFCADTCEKDPETGKILLGDILLNLNRCEEQGVEFGHGFSREVRYLTVHSVLHLLGYDHVDEGKEKERMRAKEKEIMGDEE